MEEQHSYTLVSGTFSPLSAQTVILELINRKINFHNVEILSERIKQGTENTLSEKRIEDLLKIKAQIQELIGTAIINSKTLKINCEIKIEMIDQ